MNERSNRATLSSGVIVVRRVDRSWKFLLLRVFRYWDFPKGLVEAGEEPVAAACREVCEETTVNDLMFRWGYDFRETEPYASGKVARYYVAETQSENICLPVSPELGHPEHHEFRWVDIGEASRLVSERVRPILDWAHTVIQQQ
jgi:bis(5'-nucleosidyl)-tetraphosphatase